MQTSKQSTKSKCFLPSANPANHWCQVQYGDTQSDFEDSTVDRVVSKKSRATSLCSKQNWMYSEELPNIENLNVSASFRAHV
jgi:hypothetical protein